MTAAEWIAKRRELLDAATEGPWEVTFGPREPARVWASHPGDREAVATIAGFVEDRDDISDARLIADARTSLPTALDALEAVLEIETAHVGPDQQPYDRDHSEGWNDALSTVRHAIEAALRTDA